MTNHLPLNGERVIDAIHSVLRGQTTGQQNDTPASGPRLTGAQAARAALQGIDLPDDAPDGTNGATRIEEGTEPRRQSVVDPSQGRGRSGPVLTEIRWSIPSPASPALVAGSKPHNQHTQRPSRPLGLF